jgi:hypothetical protein
MSTVARSFFDSTRHRIGPALVFGAAGLLIPTPLWPHGPATMSQSGLDWGPPIGGNTWAEVLHARVLQWGSNGERAGASFPNDSVDDGGMKSTGAVIGKVRLLQSGGTDR